MDWDILLNIIKSNINIILIYPKDNLNWILKFKFAQMENNQTKHKSRITDDIKEDDFDIEAESEAYFDDSDFVEAYKYVFIIPFSKTTIL